MTPEPLSFLSTQRGEANLSLLQVLFSYLAISLEPF